MAAVVRALGAMSGTSLDGIDAAVLMTDGTSIMDFGPTAYRRYDHAERAVLKAALNRWDGPEVEAAAEVVETAHAEILSRFTDVDLIGFHGQTLAHDPGGLGTLQVGDGSLLAELLNLPVIWDFRSADMRMGGQGAPLAPFYHHALARHVGAQAPVVFLNLGGVGNLTFVDPRISDPAAPGALLAFDTGPANAPLNDMMTTRLGLEEDHDGALAATGVVDPAVLEQFLQHPYFLRVPPKSLDRKTFATLPGMVATLSDADAAATLSAVVAASVVGGMRHCPAAPLQVLVTGGGRRNPVIMQMLTAGLDCPVVPVEDVGLDGDMIEAQAFAYLAVRVLNGLPTSCPSTTGVGAAIGGGEVSRPGPTARRAGQDRLG